MSSRDKETSIPAKKLKKVKSRNNANRRKKSASTPSSQVTHKSSDKCSDNVNPPTTINTSLDSAIIKWDPEKPREYEPYEDGDFSKMPYEAPNEVNFVGGIGANVGHRRSKKFIDRTTKIQQIYNMRCDNKTVYNFCEDPLLTHNVPPRKDVSEVEIGTSVRDTVRRIETIEHEQLPREQLSELPSIEDIIEDDQRKPESEWNTAPECHRQTENKEINLEIRRQYLDQQRIRLKQKLEAEVPQQVGDEYRMEKFKLSEYFDIDTIPEEIDVESVTEIKDDWTEKYKVEPHPCDLKFARPMPEVIPMPLKPDKLAFLTRTLEKTENMEKLRLELRKFSKPLEDNVTKDFPYRETARHLNKLLQRQKTQNMSIDLALKDFEEFMQSSMVFKIADELNEDTSVDLHQNQLKGAMEAYEEKILKQLSDPMADSSEADVLEEPSLMEIKDFKKSDHSEDDPKAARTKPVDFTHPFDVRQIKDSERRKRTKGYTLMSLTQFIRISCMRW